MGERSYLGQGSTITGDLVFPGFIEISGKINGNVSADSIVLGESAIVEGSLTASSITVRGRMKGRLLGETVALQSSARFEGEVTYGQISIESGAEVVARIRKAKS
jgi:cytoskeletal protein CcmA (bactofilin family)